MSWLDMKRQNPFRNADVELNLAVKNEEAGDLAGNAPSLAMQVDTIRVRTSRLRREDRVIRVSQWQCRQAS